MAKEREATTPADESSCQEDAQALKQHIGERLAKARQERKLDSVDAAGELRIPSAYINALEAGDWSSLPGEVYAQGFLRQYADLLAIDISDDINRLKSTDYHLTKPFTMPDPPIAPHKKWAITATVAFVVLIVFFNVRQSDDVPPQIAPPAEPQPQAVIQAEPSDIPDAELAASSPPPAAEPVPETTAPPSAQEPAGEVVEPDGHDFVFAAHGNSVWMQIFDADRQLLKEALLRPGETIQIQGQSKLFVTCGNAAALQVSMDGEIWAETGSLGRENQVRRWLEVAPG